MVIFGPRERADRDAVGGAIIGGDIGARKQKHGEWKGGRGRKLADESRSGSCRGKVVVRDQPSVAAAIVRLFLSLFLPFTSFFFSRPSLSVSLSPPLPPAPRSNPSGSRSSSSSSFPLFSPVELPLTLDLYFRRNRWHKFGVDGYLHSHHANHPERKRAARIAGGRGLVRSLSECVLERRRNN